MSLQRFEVNSRFQVRINKDWAFSESRSIETHTHNYHRYPAKFIPQIVKKLIETYTAPGDTIADVFAGCGTTLVESKIHGRKSIGVDVNPVAELITNAKINPIRPSLVAREFEGLKELILTKYDWRKKYYRTNHDRIDYWFRRWEKNKLAFLYKNILKVQDPHVRVFLLCSMSNILKNCSRWLQDSTKPQIDPNKIIADPFDSFISQTEKMVKRNKVFYQELKQQNRLTVNCKIRLADARRTRIHSESISTIITSPPYVTSYEYADIHQLTGYWFDYFSDISDFRKQFIGTFHSGNYASIEAPSLIARNSVKKLEKNEKRVAREVANYFNDMHKVAKEMKRILVPDGVACLVIGNTKLRDVRIRTAQAFAEILLNTGFEIEDVIRRRIPHKQIPPTRDKTTGKFTARGSANSKKVYPDEFIIVARKPAQ